MTLANLTASGVNATSSATKFARAKGMAKGRAGLAVLAVLPIVLLGGCINLAAPDKPIVIELNINIRQEVIYMLAEDSAETIEDNADIF